MASQKPLVDKPYADKMSIHQHDRQPKKIIRSKYRSS